MTATTSIFLQKSWFALLKEAGLPGGAAHHILDAAGLRMHLLRVPGGLESCSNFYSPDFGFEEGSQPTEISLRAFARQLRAEAPSRIMLRPMRRDTPVVALLSQALVAEDFRVDLLPVSKNWYLPCAGLSWSDYLAQRPSRLRNTLRRCQTKLRATPGFRIDIIRDAGRTLDAALAAYNRVYASSWKEAEPYPAFMPGLCHMAAAQGSLRLAVLYVRDEPAAAQVWFVKDQTASIYKLAYDARFSRLGVGTVLTAALFEHVMTVDQVSEIDFLTGDDSYKSEWMSHHRELVALLAFDQLSLSGKLRALRHFAPRWLKRKIGKTA
ncbi:GNAT family N-acetyltransferase [Viridibacterium curvum]|uniref:GNAT family N-acetyltransferase n=1 Tax=Viridibacterium curvum TaxID=1101404 RepID=A0ABP9QFL6_9RHOO